MDTTAPTPALPVLWDVVEEHLDEASFLWKRWERSLDSPRTTFAESIRDEFRCLAHVDGLAVGGRLVVERTLTPALESKDAAAAAVATQALVESGHDDLVREAAKSKAPPGIFRALEAMPTPKATETLLDLLAHPPTRAKALRAFGAKRADPGPELKAYLADPDPAIAQGAMQAARNPNGQRLRNFVKTGLSSPSPEVRSASIETGLVLGLRAALDTAEDTVRDLGPTTATLLPLLAVLGHPAATTAALAALAERRLRGPALLAAGLGGTLAAAEAALEFLADPDLGRLAGEAFRLITGFDPRTATLKEPPTPGPDLPPLSPEELAADLLPKAEASLPNLDPSAVAQWWSKERRRFTANARYLDGQPWSHLSLLATFERTSLRLRHYLAFAIAVRTRGRIDIPTRTLSENQRPYLAALRTLTATEVQHPLEKLFA